MNISEFNTIYTIDPKEDNYQYGSEDEILIKLEEQFEIRSVNYNKLDLIKYYVATILNFNLDDINLYQFETFLDTPAREESFDYMMNNLKHLFNKYFGFELSDLENDFCDFEFIYELYNIFVLDLNNTIAHFINGLRSPLNKYVQNPQQFTLSGCYKPYISVHSVESFKNSFFSTEDSNTRSEIITEIKKEDIVSKENQIALNEFVLSSVSFKELFIKCIFDDGVFDFDNFFDILCLSDETETFLKFNVYTSEGKIPFDNKILKHRIRSEIIYPENMDDIESKYRKLIELIIT